MSTNGNFNDLLRIDRAALDVKARRLRGEPLTESDEALLMLYDLVLAGAWALTRTSASLYRIDRPAASHTEYALRYMLGLREPTAATDWSLPLHSLAEYATRYK